MYDTFSDIQPIIFTLLFTGVINNKSGSLLVIPAGGLTDAVSSWRSAVGINMFIVAVHNQTFCKAS